MARSRSSVEPGAVRLLPRRRLRACSARRGRSCHPQGQSRWPRTGRSVDDRLKRGGAGVRSPLDRGRGRRRGSRGVHPHAGRRHRSHRVGRRTDHCSLAWRAAAPADSWRRPLATGSQRECRRYGPQSHSGHGGSRFRDEDGVNVDAHVVRLLPTDDAPQLLLPVRFADHL